MLLIANNSDSRHLKIWSYDCTIQNNKNKFVKFLSYVWYSTIVQLQSEIIIKMIKFCFTIIALILNLEEYQIFSLSL